MVGRPIADSFGALLKHLRFDIKSSQMTRPWDSVKDSAMEILYLYAKLWVDLLVETQAVSLRRVANLQVESRIRSWEYMGNMVLIQ